MVRNTGHTSKYYLISRLIYLFFLLFLCSVKIQQRRLEKDSTFYPGKPLIMSLIVPGLGQLYNKEPYGNQNFIATEIVSITSIIYSNKKADEIRMNYQEFADRKLECKKTGGILLNLVQKLLKIMVCFSLTIN